jgi:hypothetical protein
MARHQPYTRHLTPAEETLFTQNLTLHDVLWGRVLQRVKQLNRAIYLGLTHAIDVEFDGHNMLAYFPEGEGKVLEKLHTQESITLLKRVLAEVGFDSNADVYLRLLKPTLPIPAPQAKPSKK